MNGDFEVAVDADIDGEQPQQPSSIEQLKLSARQRQVCVLYYGKNLTQKQIARRIGISQPAVSEHLTRARSMYPHLRKQYHGRRRKVSLSLVEDFLAAPHLAA